MLASLGDDFIRNPILHIASGPRFLENASLYLSQAAFSGGKVVMVLEYAECSIRNYLNSRKIIKKLTFH
jgi:hypothetical protein